MSAGHPLIARQRVLAAKVETTAGTAVALAAAEAKFNIVGDPVVEPADEANVRESPGSFSKFPSVPGSRAATVDFTVEVANTGSATVPQWFSLLTTCGFGVSASTATIASGSATADTATVGHYLDGLLFSAAGCMFNLTISAESGKLFLAQYTGMGVFQAPTDTALLAPTYETGTVPKFTDTTLTIGGTTYLVPRFSLNLNSDVQLREDGASGSSGGFRSAVIVNRDPVFEVDVEAALLATKDWHAALVSRTEAALSLAIGTGANGIVTIAAPKLQLRTYPRKNIRNGILYYTLTMGCNKSAAAGDDDVTIVVS